MERCLCPEFAAWCGHCGVVLGKYWHSEHAWHHSRGPCHNPDRLSYAGRRRMTRQRSGYMYRYLRVGDRQPAFAWPGPSLDPCRPKAGARRGALSALPTKCTPKRTSFPCRVPQFSLPLKLHTATPQSISQTGTNHTNHRNHTDQRCRTRGSGPVSPHKRPDGLRMGSMVITIGHPRSSQDCAGPSPLPSPPSPLAVQQCRSAIAVHRFSQPWVTLLCIRLCHFLPLCLPLFLPLFPIPYLAPLTCHNGRCQSEPVCRSPAVPRICIDTGSTLRHTSHTLPS